MAASTSESSSTFDALMEQGKLRFQQKQYDEALQSYTQALPHAPKEKRYLVHSNQAACLLQLPGRERDAFEAAMECCRENPEFFKGYHRMALAMFRLNRFQAAMEIVCELFRVWDTAPKPAYSEAEAMAEFDLFAEAVMKNAALKSKTEEQMMIAALKTYLRQPTRQQRFLPIAYTIKQAPRFVAILRNTGWFSKPLPEFSKKLHEFLNQTADDEGGVRTKDREYYESSKWSILWADSPPTRTTLEEKTGLKWPSIEDFHCMRPHVSNSSRGLTVLEVENWYGDLIKGISQEFLDQLAHGKMLEESTVLPKIRLYPGRQMDWLQWYQQHAKQYHDAFCEFQQVCSDCTIFDVYTKEFVNAFASYIVARCEELLLKQDEVTIAEVGAGDGRLFRCVVNAFQRLFKAPLPTENKTVRFTACDLENYAADQHITVMNYQELLLNAKPSIVFCSWMPQGTDWTGDFRKSPLLQEYILLGPCDTGLTGDTWLTWGMRRPSHTSAGIEAPFRQDGWVRLDLHDLSCHLISKDDASNEYFNSSVVAFRRT